MAEADSTARRARLKNWAILAGLSILIVLEVVVVAQNSDFFQVEWLEDLDILRKHTKKRNDYQIIEERAADRARQSDNASIDSRVTSPADHAFQGPVPDEK